MIEDNLITLGISLPTPPTPAGAYVPMVIVDNFAYVSGQIPIEDGKVAYTGKVSDDNIEIAKKSAELCALNILAQLKRELGTLDRIKKIIRINGFVNSESGFSSHPKVINSASDLLFKIFGEIGQHSRIAVGVSSLPLNSMTEIDAVVKIS